MLNVCLRYEEMANNPNVEYTAGGNGFIAQIMKFKNCFSIWFQWIILINDEFNLILLSAGATQNSIRVAQVLYYFLLRGVEEFSSIIPLLSKWVNPLLLQWMLQIPGATTYIGCIGKDKFGEEMKKNSKLAGVNVSFLFFFFFHFFDFA